MIGRHLLHQPAHAPQQDGNKAICSHGETMPCPRGHIEQIDRRQRQTDANQLLPFNRSFRIGIASSTVTAGYSAVTGITAAASVAAAKHVEIGDVSQTGNDARASASSMPRRRLPPAGVSFIIHSMMMTGTIPSVEVAWTMSRGRKVAADQFREEWPKSPM